MYTTEQAELLAIQVVSYLAGSPEELQRLMLATGSDTQALKQSVQTREGLAGVLDYLCRDESILLGFCETHGLAANEPMWALQALQNHHDTGAA